MQWTETIDLYNLVQNLEFKRQRASLVAVLTRLVWKNSLYTCLFSSFPPDHQPRVPSTASPSIPLPPPPPSLLPPPPPLSFSPLSLPLLLLLPFLLLLLFLALYMLQQKHFLSTVSPQPRRLHHPFLLPSLPALPPALPRSLLFPSLPLLGAHGVRSLPHLLR